MKGLVKIVIINKKIIRIIFILSILAIIITIITVIDIPTKIKRIIYKKDYKEYVEKYSKEHNVDENLIYSVIKVESNFKNVAVSHKSAVGLMQLVPATAQDVAKELDLQLNLENIKEELYNPDVNINLGTKYLSMLIEEFSNIELALAAYNAGIGTVKEWINDEVLEKDGSNIENIPYKETNIYVRKVLQSYKIYSKY